MTRAILFDVDGTLLDTSEFIHQAFEHALVTSGVEGVSRAHFRSHIGKSLRDVYSAVAPLSDADAMVVAHRAFQKENLHLSKAFPGVLETLAVLHAAGIKLAAVTTRSKLNSIDTLKDAGIFPFLGAVISAEDVENLKPHPEPLFKALEILGESPEGAYMVGDASVDIEAGKSAGTHTIAVTYGMQGEDVLASNPDHSIDRFEDLLSIVGV